MGARYLKLRKMLCRHEGIKTKPYRDTVGKLTIGVGRNLDDVGISVDESMIMLANDILKAEQDCSTAFPWFASLDIARQDVIINMVFNLGISGFAAFKKTIGFLAKGEFDNAADEMLSSQWADQVGARAHELSEIMRSGKYPD